MRLRLPCWLLLALLAAKLRPLALNRLLLEPSELVGRQARLALQDRRAVHVAKVLQLRDGDTLRVGILGGGADNNATIRWIWPAGSEGTWRSDSGKPRPPRLEIEDMLNALEDQELPDFLEICLSAPAETLPLPAPVPKVDLLLVPPAFDRFQRLLPQLAQLGLGRVDLCKVPGAPRVFGCHLLRSPALLRAKLVKGLEQSGDTQVPEVREFKNLHSYLEELPESYSLRFMAERGRPSPLPQPSGSGRCLLAVGLEEGWREDEVAMLKEAGFQPLRLGDRPLTTELQAGTTFRGRAFHPFTSGATASYRLASPSSPTGRRRSAPPVSR